MRTLINIEEPWGTPILSGQVRKEEPEKRRHGHRPRRTMEKVSSWMYKMSLTWDARASQKRQWSCHKALRKLDWGIEEPWIEDGSQDGSYSSWACAMFHVLRWNLVSLTIPVKNVPLSLHKSEAIRIKMIISNKEELVPCTRELNAEWSLLRIHESGSHAFLLIFKIFKNWIADYLAFTASNWYKTPAKSTVKNTLLK